ncbi:Angio-associated migratory cell protein, putative [Ricinus communis]|uniref:Angio-associated migratory cell protein, putative n=1 Tax=Ricinus communis TaxID=3988 RepID=B9RYH5_RICCO|nr:Angio-associated migratory cell protein, putative [Ricinus communis]
MMNPQDDEGDVYLDESDIINDIILDDEDLTDVVDDEDDSSDNNDSIEAGDGMLLEGGDDSVHVFNNHAGEIYTVACSPTDATLVATGGGDSKEGPTGKKGFIWRISHGDWTAELAGKKEAVSCLSFSHDGQLLASGGLDSTVNIWDINGNQKHKFAYDAADGWHPRGHLVLAGSTDCTAVMWNADNNQLINTFSGHGGSVTCGGFTPDGKIVSTGTEDATFRVWNPVTCEAIHAISFHTERLTCLTISSDSTVALICSEDGSAKIVNITTGKIVSSLSGHSDFIISVEFAPSMLWAATGGRDKKLIIWDLPQSSPRCICNHKLISYTGPTEEASIPCAAGYSNMLEMDRWIPLRGYRLQRWENPDMGQSIWKLHKNIFVGIPVGSCHLSYDGTARVFQMAEFR